MESSIINIDINTNPSLSMGKIWTQLFWKFWKLSPFPFITGGEKGLGVQLCSNILFHPPLLNVPCALNILPKLINLALLYKVLLCGLAWLTDFLEIQSTNNLRVIFAAKYLCTYVIFSCLSTKNLKKYNSWPLCYGNMGCFWAGYDLNKVYHIWYNYGFRQICSGKKIVCFCGL